MASNDVLSCTLEQDQNSNNGLVNDGFIVHVAIVDSEAAETISNMYSSTSFTPSMLLIGPGPLK